MGASVAVTGASGKAGRAVCRTLAAAGYDVRPTDQDAPTTSLGPAFRIADLRDYGETVQVLQGAETVVHLAGIPGGHLTTPTRVFDNNTIVANNVLLAAAHLGVRRVVWASSETLLGVLFTPDAPPRYVPMDDDHTPYPRMPYSLSKLLTEVSAEHISRWSGMTIIGLRLSHILEVEDYEAVMPGYWEAPGQGALNAWGYVDSRDVAEAVLGALGADLSGSHNMLVAAADTKINRPTRDLLAEFYPDVPVRRDMGEFESLIDSSRAHELIGYTPRHSWRDHLTTT